MNGPYFDLVVLCVAFVIVSVWECWRQKDLPRVWFKPLDEPHDAPTFTPTLREDLLRRQFEAMTRTRELGGPQRLSGIVVPFVRGK